MKAITRHASPNISWFPLIMLPCGTKMALYLSTMLGCRYMQMVATRHADTSIPLGRVVTAELAWDHANLWEVALGKARARDMALFSTKKAVQQNNAKVRAAYGSVLIGHNPQGNTPLVEVSPRDGFPFFQLLLNGRSNTQFLRPVRIKSL